MTSFIQAVKGDIVAVGEAAWAQTKAELEVLGAEALAIVKADIQAVMASLESGDTKPTVESIETELLNLWEQNKPQIIQALSSGAIQLLIALAKTAAAGV